MKKDKKQFRPDFSCWQSDAQEQATTSSNQDSSVIPPQASSQPSATVTGKVDNLSASTQATTATATSESSSVTVNPPMSYGWVCPKCGRVNAPWKPTCDCYQSEVNPSTPPSTPNFPNPDQTNPYAPYGPYKWGDAPGWWHWGPTCQGGGLGDSIPCDSNLYLHRQLNHTTSIGEPDPNVKIWSTQAQETNREDI